VVTRLREKVLFEECPVEHVNCEGAKGRLYADVLF
jgi:hypothetical protein